MASGFFDKWPLDNRVKQTRRRKKQAIAPGASTNPTRDESSGGAASSTSVEARSDVSSDPSESSSGVGPIRRKRIRNNPKRGGPHYNWGLQGDARPSPPEITPPITPHSSMSSASSVPSPVSFSHGLQSPISSRRRGAVSVGLSHSSPDFAYDTPSDFQRSARVPLIQTPTWPLTTEQDQLYQHHWAQCGEVPPTSWAPPSQFTNAGYTQHGVADPQENAPYEPNQQPDSMFSESFNTLSTHSFNPPLGAPFQDDAPNLAGQCFNSSAIQLHYDTSPLTSYVANPTPETLSFTTRDPDPGTPVPSNPRYFPPAVHSHYSEHLPDVGDNAPFQDTPFYNSGPWATQPSGFVQNNNCASHVSHDGHGGSGPYAWDGQRRSSLATLTFFHPTE